MEDASGAEAQQQSQADSAEPSSLCCPVMQTMFRDPVFVPDSGNTYEREALLTFWRASQVAGAPPRDPLNNTVLTSTQVFANWDKRREVAAWLQDHPDFVPTGWASRTDIPPVGARAADSTGDAGLRRHMHVEFNLNLNLGITLRTLGIVAFVVASLSYGCGLNELAAHTVFPGSQDGTRMAAAAVAAAEATAAAAAAAERHANHPLPRRSPPEGSRVRVVTTPCVDGGAEGEVLTVLAPPLPAADLEFADIGTACVVLLFVYTWTQQATSGGAPFLFVLCSAPFWFSGGVLLRKAVIRHVETSSLSITRESLVVSENLAGVFARTAHVALRDITNFQVKTKMIDNGRPHGVLEIRERDTLHEWGASLSMLELDFVHRQVVNHLALLDTGDPGCSVSGARPLYLPGGNFWTFARDSPVFDHRESLNRILLEKFSADHVVSPKDFVAHQGQALLPDPGDRSRLFDELRAKGYVVSDDHGDFHVRLPKN